MGSEKVGNDVVFDTGSGWLTVTLKQCATCTQPKYDPTKSQTAQVNMNDVKTLSYGSATLKGLVISDQACLGKSNCIPDFKFMGIMEQSGL